MQKEVCREEKVDSYSYAVGLNVIYRYFTCVLITREQVYLPQAKFSNCWNVPFDSYELRFTVDTFLNWRIFFFLVQICSSDHSGNTVRAMPKLTQINIYRPFLIVGENWFVCYS